MAGGAWAVAQTPVATGDATGIFSIAFRDAVHGVVVGGNYQREGDAIDNVALTSDGGVTWKAVGARAVGLPLGGGVAARTAPAGGRPAGRRLVERRRPDVAARRRRRL